MDRIRPYDLADVSRIVTVEAGALVCLARSGAYEQAQSCADDLPRRERALVLLAVGDAALIAGDRDAATRAYSTASLYASTRVSKTYIRVEAAAQYGLALIAIADRNTWDAAMHLRRAAEVLSESWVDRENEEALEEISRLRDEVLSGVTISSGAGTGTRIPSTV